jgi:hypothetical protein
MGMPVTWDYRGRVLVLKAAGVSAEGDLERAFAEASADPRFAQRPCLLVDGRDSQTALSAADIQVRVEFFRSLPGRGVFPRFAFVLRDGPLLASARAAAQAERGKDAVELALFAREDEALAWLERAGKS